MENSNIDFFLKNYIKLDSSNLESCFPNKKYVENNLPNEDNEDYNNEQNWMCLNSNSYSEHKGPNINLKFNKKKRYSNQKEKKFFLDKIKNKKKTELCKNYELYKDCYFGDNCSFAHGANELRDNYVVHLYKTKTCKCFLENKICNFGVRCSYQHKIK